MSGTVDNLVRMANQIAANLSFEKDPISATCDHIRSFWDPGMRSQILAAPDNALSPIALAAIDRMRQE